MGIGAAFPLIRRHPDIDGFQISEATALDLDPDVRLRMPFLATEVAVRESDRTERPATMREATWLARSGTGSPPLGRSTGGVGLATKTP